MGVEGALGVAGRTRRVDEERRILTVRDDRLEVGAGRRHHLLVGQLAVLGAAAGHDEGHVGAGERLADLRCVLGRADHGLGLAVTEPEGQGVGAEQRRHGQGHGPEPEDGHEGHGRLERGRLHQPDHVALADPEPPQHVGQAVGLVLHVAEGVGAVGVVRGDDGEGHRRRVLLVDAGDPEVELFRDVERPVVHLAPELVVAGCTAQERLSHVFPLDLGVTGRLTPSGPGLQRPGASLAAPNHDRRGNRHARARPRIIEASNRWSWRTTWPDMQ